MHDEETEVGLTGARFGSPSLRKRLREERKRAKEKSLEMPPETHAAPQPEPDDFPTQEHFPTQDFFPVQDIEVVPEEPETPPSTSTLVRPFVRTGGRTTASYDLRLETLISCEEHNLWQAGHDQVSMMRLCVDPRSVAEIAALSDMPIGVARVLLSDLITAGLVAVHERDAPDMALLERVLAGLHRL